MKKTIKAQTRRLFNQKNVRKYEFTQDGLQRFIALRPRAQQMLVDILNYIGHETSLEALVVNLSSFELGFNSTTNMISYRNELIENRFVFYDRKYGYYVNPCFVNYYTRRQKEYLNVFFSIKKNKYEPKLSGKLRKIS